VSAKTAFTTRIETFSRARRALQNASLRYLLGCYGACCGIFGLVFLSGWLPNAFVNLALFAAVALAVVFLVVWYSVRRQRFRSHMDEAFAMEELAGGLNSRLISALDFTGREQMTPLMRATVEHAEEDLKLELEKRLDRTRRNALRKRFAGVLAIYMAIGLTPWFGFPRLAANFHASLFGVSEFFFPVEYAVDPAYGQYVHKVGLKVNVTIRFKTRGYQSVTLVEQTRADASPGIDTGAETEIKRHKLQVDASGRAALPIEGAFESTHRVHFEFGDRKTREVVLVFTNAPLLENMQSELIYPAYTRMLPKPLEGVQDHFYALPKTRIVLGFTFSKPLKSAWFEWDDGSDAQQLDVSGRFASTSILHSRNRVASLQVKDENDLPMEHPFAITFDLQSDEKPQVFLPRSLTMNMPMLAEGLKLFGFGVRLEDDYGVSRCVLKWSKATIGNPNAAKQMPEIERLVSPPQRKTIREFQKVFESLDAQPGDLITFRVEVYDNRSPDPQVAVSPTKSIFIYQQNLDDLKIASLGFGSGAILRGRISQSKRATSVKEPGAMKTTEQVRNEYEARIDTTTRAPIVPSGYAQPVKDYFRLMSTAVEKDNRSASPQPGTGQQDAPPGVPDED